VRGRPLEILATRVSDDKRIVAVHTDVDWIAEDANTVIALGVAVCDLEGSVGRGIVTDHELEVAKCLPEDRFDGLPEPSGRVMHRHPHADAWRVRGLSVPRGHR